jgi:hypothetical protein
MDLEEIKEFYSDAEHSTSVTREEASDMLVFGRVTQWDGEFSENCQIEYRGTFDYIKPKRNRILKDLWSNPVDIVFKPKDGADPDAADTLTGMFRADMQRSEEARETALQDQVDCGFGAFRFTTEYESKFDDLNNYQRISMEPISEANNVVYFDANAKKKDKSDATGCGIISTFTKSGWKKYCEENGIDAEENESPMPFRTPEKSRSYFWNAKTDEIKVGEFYEKKKKKERVLIYEDPLGQTKAVYQRDVKNVIDDMEAAGFVKIGEKMKERYIVTKYLVTGDKILKKQRIAGEHIPVIPVYGDWSRVEGREIWRGIYYDAQDAQRLANFSLSYFADTVSQGAREKPILYPGQVQGYEFMWTQTGASDNYPYRLLNDVSPDGTPYPNQPISYLKPPEMPSNVIGLIQAMRQSIDDVTGGQMDSQQMMSGAVTEGQINQARKGLEDEAYLYQNSFALAMKQAARVYASMAAELYDVPREVTVQAPDGTETTAMIMESIFDEETGEDVSLNDLTTGTFDVYAAVGPSFQSQKEESLTRLQTLYESTAGTEFGNLVLLTYAMEMEGPGMTHLKEWAKKQLILQGVIEPETDEDKQILEQASQQQQQPDANMMLAMAEMKKAEASTMNAQFDAQNDQQSTQIKMYEAMTKRAKVEADAQKAGVEIQKTLAETESVELENIRKQMEALTDQDLFRIASGG